MFKVPQTHTQRHGKSKQRHKEKHISVISLWLPYDHTARVCGKVISPTKSSKKITAKDPDNKLLSDMKYIKSKQPSAACKSTAISYFFTFDSFVMMNDLKFALFIKTSTSKTSPQKCGKSAEDRDRAVWPSMK